MKLRYLQAAIADLEQNRVVGRFAKYIDDPVGFITEGLGGFIWSKQKEICRSVVVNRRTAVKACHDVGKSAISARIAAWWLSCRPPGEAFVVTAAPTFAQVRGILWREINSLHRKAGLPGTTNQTEWWINDELVAFGRSPADTNPEAFQGIHAKYVLVILDEACGIVKALWPAVEALITNEYSRLLSIGNPDNPATEFFEVCKPGSGHNVIHISAFDSPNLSGEEIPEWLKPLLVSKLWVEEKRKSWGETSPLWLAKIMGQFPDQSADGLVSFVKLREAILRELAPVGDIEFGVDIARFGQDRSIAYKRQGPVARKIMDHAKKDTMETTGVLVQLIKEHKPSRVKIDDTGVGGGVTDRLNELQRAGELPEGVQIVPINVGEAPATTGASERFINLRAELNWAVRERFMQGDIDLEDNDELQSQGAAIKYKLTSRGQLQIESKDDMRKRGLSSPDDWDALVLAFAKPDFPGSGFLDFIAAQQAEAEKAKKA